MKSKFQVVGSNVIKDQLVIRQFVYIKDAHSFAYRMNELFNL